MKTNSHWQTIDEALREVQLDALARTTLFDSDWFDPTDAGWWSECPQIGDLDANACAEAWAQLDPLHPINSPFDVVDGNTGEIVPRDQLEDTTRV